MIFGFQTVFHFGIKTSCAGFLLLILCISLRQVLLGEHTYKTYWACWEYIVFTFFYCEVYNLPKREYIQFVVKNSWKINCTLPYSPVSSGTEHLLHSLKPRSISVSLPAEDNQCSDFHSNHSLAFVSGFAHRSVLLNMPFKNNLYVYAIMYFSLSCCFCLSFLSLKYAGALNWHTSCFLLCAVLWCECAMIYLSIFLSVHIWLFLVISATDNAALSTSSLPISWCMCGVASLGCVCCWEWDRPVVGFAPDHHY